MTEAPRRRRLLIATRSAHKLGELRTLLDLPAIELLSLDDVQVEGEPAEDADSFAGNALIKARFYAARSDLPTLADDSGLEVDALGGGPGVRTRRYAGERASDEQNNAKLLRELDGIPAGQRTARYRCALVVIDPTLADGPGSRGEPIVREGVFEGRIALAARGSAGFGYDPVFEPLTEPPGGRTVGQLSAEEKNRVSHRALAAQALARELRRLGW
ncbi:MAG TPA: non-canonical purine NTP pyrophosphatase [Candidatus Limnocylindrales bacterium]|nr:non-canonical purine NTP pyrophosphatase [Candidatus Limnocylindrales bacterium]